MSDKSHRSRHYRKRRNGFKHTARQFRRYQRLVDYLGTFYGPQEKIVIVDVYPGGHGE